MSGYISIPLGFLLGSIPSASIVCRLLGKRSLAAEGDGHVSATAVYRNAGRFPFVITVLADVAKAALAVWISSLLTGEVLLIIAAGILVVAGHCWSPFIKFRGGLGGTVIIGALFGFAWWQLLACLSATAILFFVTKRSTLSTIMLALFMAVALYFTRNDWLSAIFPLLLLAVQFIKRATIKNKDNNRYKNDLFRDLKRVK